MVLFCLLVKKKINVCVYFFAGGHTVYKAVCGECLSFLTIFIFIWYSFFFFFFWCGWIIPNYSLLYHMRYWILRVSLSFAMLLLILLSCSSAWPLSFRIFFSTQQNGPSKMLQKNISYTILEQNRTRVDWCHPKIDHRLNRILWTTKLKMMSA